MEDIKSKVVCLLGILSILYYMFFMIFSGIVGFHIIWLFLGVFLITLKYFKTTLIRGYSKLNIKVKAILKCFIVVGLVSFIIIEFLIIYFGISKTMTEKRYMMVLGAAVHGEYMSLILKERMDKSLEYLEKYPNTKVIVSGGQGPGELITEAEAMKRYLIKNGIKENQIIKEEQSRNTSENFKYSLDILKQRKDFNDSSVCVVTTNFHMFRAKFLGGRAGIDVCRLPAKGHLSSALNYYIREYFGVIHSFICDNPK